MQVFYYFSTKKQIQQIELNDYIYIYIYIYSVKNVRLFFTQRGEFFSEACYMKRNLNCDYVFSVLFYPNGITFGGKINMKSVNIIHKSISLCVHCTYWEIIEQPNVSNDPPNDPPKVPNVPNDRKFQIMGHINIRWTSKLNFIQISQFKLGD